MKNIILFTPILLMLVSCGPSQKEKEEIAILTCNIMGESRNMDASVRLKEINLAREQIGEERYLSTDDVIKEAFKYGLCKELVLNNDYQNKLLEAKNIIKTIEEQAEETRRQELAEIEAGKAAKEAKRKEIQEKWRTAIVSHFKEVKTNNELNETNVAKNAAGWRLTFFIDCSEETYGFHKSIKILFKDNMGTLTSRNIKDSGNSGSKNCDKYGGMVFQFRAWEFVGKPDLVEKLDEVYPRGTYADIDEDVFLDEFVENMSLLINGVSREEPPKDFKYYMPAVYGDMLDKPYVLKKLR